MAAPPRFEAAREGGADGKKGGRRALAIVEKNPPEGKACRGLWGCATPAGLRVTR